MIPLRDTIRSQTTPVMTVGLIVLNTLAFMEEASVGRHLPELIDALGFTPVRFTHWTDLGGAPFDLLRFIPLLSAAFLHGGWAHLIGNMWFLWIFGDNVEDRLGHGRFVLFYLLCAIASFAVHGLFNPESEVPAVGASGAIAGVLGAYFVFYPKSRVITFVPVFFLPWLVEIPALLFIGFWFLIQLLNGLLELGAAQGRVTNIAWWAHAGGFVAGIILGLILKKRSRPAQPYRSRQWGYEK